MRHAALGDLLNRVPRKLVTEISERLFSLSLQTFVDVLGVNERTSDATLKLWKLRIVDLDSVAVDHVLLFKHDEATMLKAVCRLK